MTAILSKILRDRNPVEFLQRRADALPQRAADLKKLVQLKTTARSKVTRSIASAN
jgi:hypothetical protein